MRGAYEAEGNFRTQLDGVTDAYGLEVLEGVLGFVQCIQGKRGVVLRLLDLVVEARVFFLQVAGIRQDDAAQINRWRSGVDRAAKAFFDQAWDPSAVVEMGMGEDDGINFFRRDWSVVPIALAPFFGALEHATVDQNLQAALSGEIACVDEMLGSGDCAGRA